MGHILCWPNTPSSITGTACVCPQVQLGCPLIVPRSAMSRKHHIPQLAESRSETRLHFLCLSMFGILVKSDRTIANLEECCLYVYAYEPSMNPVETTKVAVDRKLHRRPQVHAGNPNKFLGVMNRGNQLRFRGRVLWIHCTPP